MDERRKSGDQFVHVFFVYIFDQPLQSKVVEARRFSFCVSKQISGPVMLKGRSENSAKGNMRDALHRPHRQPEDESKEDKTWAQRSGQSGLVWGATDDEREDAENEVGREKHDEAASRRESDSIVDSPKELTEREEEKEDRDMEEDRDALDHPPHLKLGQALEEMCADAATLLGRGTELRVLQVFPRPLLDQGGHERTREAEEETYEHEDVDADGHVGGSEASGVLRASDRDGGRGDRGAAVRLGLGNQLGQERDCGAATIRKEHLVCFDDECRNDGREQARLLGRRVSGFDIRLRDPGDMAYVQKLTWHLSVPSMSQRAPCRACRLRSGTTSRPCRMPIQIHSL